MWKLKACPRCRGDVFIDRELDSWYEQCLQCGYQRELRDICIFGAQSAHEKEPLLVRVKEQGTGRI